MMGVNKGRQPLSLLRASFILEYAWYLLPGALFLVLWQLSVSGSAELEFLFGSPLAVMQVAILEIPRPEMWRHIGVTGGEALAGLVVGTVTGTLCALGLWRYHRLARVIEPYIVIGGAIPVFAVAPMLIMWFGIGWLAKVVMSACGVFFVALAHAHNGARSCGDSYSDLLLSLRVPRGRFLMKVIIPGVPYSINRGLRTSISVALMGAFIGEFVSSQCGLGHYILRASSLYDTPRVIFGIMLLSMLALGATHTLAFSERYFRR